jgi:hypothetical protein
MNPSKLAAMVLMIAGVLGLAYGGFSYTKATHRADVGPIHMEMDEKQHVNVPAWAGLCAILAGGILLVRGRPG